MIQQNFWQKNQVFITGIAGALVLALQQFIVNPEGAVDWKVIGLAAIMGVASWAANELRGKGVTVAGFIGIVAQAFVTIQTTGHFSWNNFILFVIVGFLSIVAPPPKPAAYEQSATITEARAEANVIQQKVEKSPPAQI